MFWIAAACALWALGLCALLKRWGGPPHGP